MNYPKTAAQFFRLIEPHLNYWRVATLPADPDDVCSKVKTQFRLAADLEGHAHVEKAHGRLIVCFDRVGYHFELDRLHKDFPYWSWQRQIRGKSWCRPQHLALLDWLDRLLPPAKATARSASPVLAA